MTDALGCKDVNLNVINIYSVINLDSFYLLNYLTIQDKPIKHT